MTVIQLDSATLAQIKATGQVMLADESGNQMRLCVPSVPDREPELTKEEWEELENDPVEYTLAEAWEKIRRGENL